MKHILNTALISVLLVACFLSSVVSASALNRKEAVELVGKIKADFESNGLDIYINDQADEEEPGVMIGDHLSYTILSEVQRHLLLVLIHPKGDVSVLFPDFAVQDQPGQYTRLVYPAEGTGEFTQGGPVGIETVVVIASDMPLTIQDYGLPANSDVHSVGSDANSIGRFVSTTNQLLSGGKAEGKFYQYFVDADVQFGTRAVRRELKRRVEQVDLLAGSESSENNADRTTSVGSTTQSTIAQSESLSVNDIRFELNSAKLTQKGRIQLDIFGVVLQEEMVENKDISITFEGHTDNSGPADYNQGLSERRAHAVKKYLVEQYSLPASRIITHGAGEVRPLVPNSSAENRALNRRVEVLVSK